MSITLIVALLIALGLIGGGILLLKQSAKKFNLSEEQIKRIQARNDQLNKQEESDK